MNDNIISIITGIATGIVSAIIASILYDKLRELREKKPLNTLLNFGRKEPIIFVFTHRTDSKPTLTNSTNILPRTSTEDFLAINNIKTALLKIHWDGKDGVRQPNGFTDSDKMKYIFSIGSMKSNDFTADIEKSLIAQQQNAFRVTKLQDSDEFCITDGVAKYESQTYSQVSEYLKNGIQQNELAEQTYEDFAYITKTSNIFDPKNRSKIYIVAGIRGIGTWGAAECLKKQWKQIYDKIDSSKKDTNFSAVIRIKYKRLDITDIKVISVNILKD
jgi:hypothetical protein